MTFAAGYSIAAVCDGDCCYKARFEKATYEAYALNKRDAFRDWRRAGWKVDEKNNICFCPLCAKEIG